MNLLGVVKLTPASSFINYFINIPTQDYSLAVIQNKQKMI